MTGTSLHTSLAEEWGSPVYGMFMFTLLLLSPAVSSPALAQAIDDALTGDEPVRYSAEAAGAVHVGEPFNYRVTVLYDPSRATPDFRRLLRDVRLVPFEQVHRTRTGINEDVLAGGIQRYRLSYTMIGIDVSPGETYELQPPPLHYSRNESGMEETLTLPASEVMIETYATDDPLAVPLQALKGQAVHHNMLIRVLIISSMVLLLLLALVQGWRYLRRRPGPGQSLADIIRREYDSLRAGADVNHDKVIRYERLLLTLTGHYLGRGARYFWTGQGMKGDAGPGVVKGALETAYTVASPASQDVTIIESHLDALFAQIEPDSARERQTELESRQGTLWQRGMRHKRGMLVVLLYLLLAMGLAGLLLNPQVWRERDAVIYNQWLSSLPERLSTPPDDHAMSLLDVEMLSHLASEQRVLERLQSDKLRNAYLYNYGTMVATVYRSILTMPAEDEEEEAAEPPSFTFPLQLLANAVRFYPQDTDSRRNLETVIRLRQNEKDQGAEEVQGELGPPTPGFSRDMNQVLF